MRLIFFLLMMLPFAGWAQSIQGVVATAQAGPLTGVEIQNIYSGDQVLSADDGHFVIAVQPGQLVEFHKPGFKTARVRIGGRTAAYYRIVMEPGVAIMPELHDGSGFKSFQDDSLYYHNLFKKQIDFPVLTGWRAFQSPFSALGKTNQNMIRFQHEYAWLEQQKYVDYTFNPKLIAQLTGLKGDSVQTYMRQFRPSYELLRAMPEYDFFRYVKTTVDIWRERQRINKSRGRSSG
ncbi:MAG: hypothetical protein JST06_12145 [Bacteroidetes bacterium]|nr:hypothetical protein [Bacteroidota bacterium]MBS1630649.1 hypothetical protein [Bacteroidota bacterium]